MSGFFVFEGLDGCGKSTQIEMFLNHLRRRNLPCRCLHFPRTTGSFFADMIARFLRGEFGEASEVPTEFVALLYAGDRAQATDDIKEWRQQKVCIVADRYTYSNLAFQAAKVEGQEQKKRVHDWIETLEFQHYAIERPVLSIYLHVPFEFVQSQLSRQRSGDERKYLNGKDDIHEASMGLQRRVEAEYLSLCDEREDLALLDCTSGDHMLTPDEIHEKVLELIPL